MAKTRVWLVTCIAWTAKLRIMAPAMSVHKWKGWMPINDHAISINTIAPNVVCRAKPLSAQWPARLAPNAPAMPASASIPTPVCDSENGGPLRKSDNGAHSTLNAAKMRSANTALYAKNPFAGKHQYHGAKQLQIRPSGSLSTRRKCPDQEGRHEQSEQGRTEVDRAPALQVGHGSRHGTSEQYADDDPACDSTDDAPALLRSSQRCRKCNHNLDDDREQANDGHGHQKHRDGVGRSSNGER